MYESIYFFFNKNLYNSLETAQYERNFLIEVFSTGATELFFPLLFFKKNADYSGKIGVSEVDVYFIL